MNENDLFDFGDIEETPKNSNEDVFDFGDITEEQPKEEVVNEDNIKEIEGEENKSDDTDTKEQEETEVNEKEETDNTITEGDDEEIDLGDLFDQLDTEIETSEEALNKIEESGLDTGEIGILRDSLKRMEDQIRKLNRTNADLKFRNAELEAFSVEDSDPKIMVIIRNFGKAKDGDDRSRSKTITALKDLLYELTGEDFDETKINKDIDMLTASEMYNNKINQKLKAKEDDDIYGEITV